MNEFRRQLTYKQLIFGTVVELVDRWFPSSKICSECGHIQPIAPAVARNERLKLRDRVFRYQGCGSLKCRDFNASLNLENAPLLKVRVACDERRVATVALSEPNDCGQDAADSLGRSSK